jgi:PTS system galactitol-specific IIA component
MPEAILTNIRVIPLSGGTREEVLITLSQSAVEAGFAKDGHREALLEREEAYPTGLHLKSIDVAIPHTDVEWTVKPSITIGVLDDPVDFEPMGGAGDIVKARLVFLLTIADASEHLSFLRAFASIVEDPDILLDFVETRDPQPLLEWLAGEMKEPARQE